MRKPRRSNGHFHPQFRLNLTCLAVLISLSACVEGPVEPATEFDEDQLTAAHVINGTPTNRFKSVGHLCSQHPSLDPWVDDPLFTIVGDWLCYPGAAVLVSPGVALTVAHAAPFFESTEAIRVGVQFANRLDGDAPILVGEFTPHPNWDAADPVPNDVGVIVFEEPVRQIRPSRLPRRIGEVDERAVAGQTKATVVGFGLTDYEGFPTAPAWGVKTAARTTLRDVEPTYVTTTIGGPGEGTGCIGESGAPVYRGNGQGQVIWGLGSLLVSGECDYIGYARLDTHSVRDFLAAYLPARRLPKDPKMRN